MPLCPEHKVEMVRRKSKFGNNYWYGCPRYPECHITCAEHPDGKMMSTPADVTLKALRMRAHDLLEEMFGDWEDKTVRKKMYAWLSTNSKTVHIGMMPKEELLDTITKMKQHLREKPDA